MEKEDRGHEAKRGLTKFEVKDRTKNEVRWAEYVHKMRLMKRKWLCGNLQTPRNLLGETYKA